MPFHSVAIDGPSGAGKSTMAQQLAKEIGFRYVDTGAIYRTLGVLAFQKGVAYTDRTGIVALLPQAEIQVKYEPDGLQHMILRGKDVTREIRRNEISQYASGVAAVPEVRAFLLGMQRKLALEHNIVMDGRDIGTVVLPNADLKIYLTASAEARARRRQLELLSRGSDLPFETVLREIQERDEIDMNREVAPLRQAEEAILVDTTELDLKESLAKLRQIVKEKLGL